eukprot:756688-Hanusia_phi.AAC.3
MGGRGGENLFFMNLLAQLTNSPLVLFNLFFAQLHGFRSGQVEETTKGSRRHAQDEGRGREGRGGKSREGKGLKARGVEGRQDKARRGNMAARQRGGEGGEGKTTRQGKAR